MIFLWIILALILLVVFVLLLRVRLIFDFHEKATITIQILWFRFDANQLIDKFLTKDNSNTQDTNVKQSKSAVQKKRNNRPGDLLGFIEFLLHIADVLSGALKDYLSKTKVYLKELHVSIGTDDAARTALACSGAVQAANGLCAVLQHYSKFRCDPDNLSISPDFLSDKSKFSLHLTLSSTIVHLIGVYLRANMRFFD